LSIIQNERGLTYCLAYATFPNRLFMRKDFDDLFVKICRMLQVVGREYFAKPDKRRMSEEGGRK